MAVGWLKLHRKMAKWEWYQDSLVLHLFIHMLLHANFEPGRWQGRDILPGQLVTGRKTLALETGISEQSIRTALAKLKSTSEITIESCNQYSIITILNWTDYQDDNQHANQPSTSHQPAINQQLTTIKEGKKERKKESITPCGPPESEKTSDDLFTDSPLPKKTPKRKQLIPLDDVTRDMLEPWISENITADIDIDHEINRCKNYPFKTPHSDGVKTIRTWLLEEQRRHNESHKRQEQRGGIPSGYRSSTI